MTVRYLLDTNVLSEPLRPKPNRHLLNRLERHQDEIATSSVTWHELLYGARVLGSARKRDLIERYLEEVVRRSMPILPYDAAAAEYHASERARLRALGRTPPFADGQVAGVAKVNALVIVTRNVADYEAFGGVTMENWYR